MKKIRRIATLMLAIIMAASTAVIPSYAESDIQYSESDLHELIDYDMAVDAGHVNRLNDEEDLNTLIFANEDNTKTMYFYGEDIKYTDEFGVVRDKTNKLTSTATGYTNADNDISIHLPNTLSDGITIDYDDISLMLIPVVSELPDHIEADDIATSRGEADYVVYDDVFGAKTSLKYTPMYSGLKEDIILEEYTGVSEFQFFLYTRGLELDEVDNEYVLLDGEDTVAQLSQVFIYDSEYNTAVGSMIVTPIKDDQIYAITVCADVDFLTAPSTVYPVTVDPTIEIKHNAVTIDDAILSAAYPTSNFGSSDTLMVGGNYQAYTALRFMGLNNNSTFSLLSAAQITGAMLHLTCTSKGSTTATMYVNQYSPTATSSGWWSESGITYSGNGVNTNSSIVGSSKTISTVSTHSISIINIVKAWADSTSLIEQGLLLSLSDSQYGNSNCYAYFASSEHSTTSSRPYISINYGNYAYFCQKYPRPSSPAFSVNNLDILYYKTPSGLSEQSWLERIYESGCVVCSMAMILRTLGATTTTAKYDVRTGTSYILQADPFTVILANTSFPSITYSSTDGIYIANTTEDPVQANYNRIAGAFGRSATLYDLSGSEDDKAKDIAYYLSFNPEGIAVRFKNSNGRKHTIVFTATTLEIPDNYEPTQDLSTSDLNNEEFIESSVITDESIASWELAMMNKTVSGRSSTYDSLFTVSDPVSSNLYSGNQVLFGNSYTASEFDIGDAYQLIIID